MLQNQAAPERAKFTNLGVSYPVASTAHYCLTQKPCEGALRFKARENGLEGLPMSRKKILWHFKVNLVASYGCFSFIRACTQRLAFANNALSIQQGQIL